MPDQFSNEYNTKAHHKTAEEILNGAAQQRREDVWPGVGHDSGNQSVYMFDVTPPAEGQPAVHITLDSAGGERMLATTSENVGKPMAVVAVQNAGSGRSMVLTADTTHRWYLPNRALGRENPYVKLWGQAIRWLASEEVEQHDALRTAFFERDGEPFQQITECSHVPFTSVDVADKTPGDQRRRRSLGGA